MSGTPCPLRAGEGAAPRQDEVLWCRLRERSTRVVPGTGKMIREQEHRVPEQSLTFTNHRMWRGSKDGSRLAAGLSRTAGTAHQVPPCYQPGHAGCLQPPSRGAGQGAGAGVRTPALAGTWHWEGSADGWTDGLQRQEMKPVHHASLLYKDAPLPEHVGGVRGHSLMLLLACREHTSRARGEVCTGTHAPWPPARTHRGPRPAVPADGESTEPARKW